MSDNWKGGYKTPPVARRFKPGQSGNPKGRKKKRRNAPLDIIMGILMQPISIEVNGRRLRGPGIELVARRLVRKAASGDSRALKLATELTDRAYAWKNKNSSSGQMPVYHLEGGKLRPGRPTRAGS